MNIRLNQNHRSKDINVTEGILQGDPLSAILFILFLSDAVQFYIDKGYLNIENRMEISLFADDKTISATSESNLQDQIKLLEE